MLGTLFDPLDWLARMDAGARLETGGGVTLSFGAFVRPAARRRVLAVLPPYLPLLRLQLAVPPGALPRAVRQLLAAGRLCVREGKYEVEGRPPVWPAGMVQD